LATLARLDLSAKRVALITERVGRSLAKRRDAATVSFLSGQAKAPSAAPELLLVSADGGRVQTRQKDPDEKWKESKVGVVYEAHPAPDVPGQTYEGPEPERRSVVATLDPWDGLGDHLSALAAARGYARAKTRLFLSDGAAAIRSQRERAFPDATFILDWAHAAQHLHESALAGFGATDQAQRWFEQQKERLWKGRLRSFFHAFDRLCRRRGEPPRRAAENDPRRILANNRRYFRDNRDGIDYPLYRRNGWPLGSGVVEAAIKQLGLRVKGTEKHWAVSGAEQTLQVMTALISDDDSWNAFWKCPPTKRAA
jgi:hypothetical protein